MLIKSTFSDDLECPLYTGLTEITTKTSRHCYQYRSCKSKDRQYNDQTLHRKLKVEHNEPHGKSKDRQYNDKKKKQHYT